MWAQLVAGKGRVPEELVKELDADALVPGLRAIVRRAEAVGASEARAVARAKRWVAGREKAGEAAGSESSDDSDVDSPPAAGAEAGAAAAESSDESD